MAESIEQMLEKANTQLAEMKAASVTATAEQKAKITALELQIDELKANKGMKAEDVAAAITAAVKTATDDMQKQLDEAAAKQKQNLPATPVSMAEHILKALKDQPDHTKSNLVGGKGGQRKEFALQLETKTVGDMTLAVNLVGSTGVPTYQPGIVGVPFYPIHFRQLTGVLPSETDTYHFIRHDESIGEGGFAVQSTENTAKSQRDYDFTDVTVNLNPLAGIVVVSRKMLRNIPALAAYLGQYLPEDYLQAEDALAYTALSGSSGLTTGHSGYGWMSIIATIGDVEDAKYYVNGIVVRPRTFYTLLSYRGTTYDFNLPGVVTMENGIMRVNGIPVYKAVWVPTDKCIVGDWTRMKIIQSEALNVRSTEFDGYNFSENNITYRCEAVVGYAVERPAGFSIIDLGFE